MGHTEGLYFHITDDKECYILTLSILSKAVEALNGATRVKPVAPLFVLLGKTQIKARQWKDAVKSFEKALEIVVRMSCLFRMIIVQHVAISSVGRGEHLAKLVKKLKHAGT